MSLFRKADGHLAFSRSGRLPRRALSFVFPPFTPAGAKRIDDHVLPERLSRGESLFFWSFYHVPFTRNPAFGPQLYF
jgi:hypothetical protein